MPHLARVLNKHFAVVRKSGHHSSDHVSDHATRAIEGRIGHRWVFVDDLISSGETAKRVRMAVTEAALCAGWQTEFVGTVLYRSAQWLPAEDTP